jgi:hypothetical protein
MATGFVSYFHPMRFCFLLAALSCLRLAAQPAAPQLSAIPYPMFWDNPPLSASGSGDRLTVTAGPKTDMFRDPSVTYNTDNAPKLMFRPEGDFILTAVIGHRFANKWDGGALVLRSDSLNWVKFCYEKDYTGARRVVSVVTRNLSDDCNSVALKGNRAYYKLARAGSRITLYCSPNGKRWLLVRHFQFDAAPGFSVGFLAQSPTGGQCEVSFSEIRFEARTLEDPYTVE